MYLLYVDESGDPTSGDEENFVMGGLAVFERQVYWLSENLDDLQQRYLGALNDPVEFHAKDINAGRANPWHSLSANNRSNLQKDIYGCIAGANEPGVVLFAVTLHKPSFPNQNPVERCFEELCNRFDLFLTRLYNDGNQQKGLIVLDESRYKPRLEELMAQYRKAGTRFGRVRNLVDVPLFTDSDLTRMLQLADCVAWATFRRYERGDSRYFDMIVHRFDQAGGKLHGLVHLTAISPNCWCPACLTRR